MSQFHFLSKIAQTYFFIFFGSWQNWSGLKFYDFQETLLCIKAKLFGNLAVAATIF